MTLHVNDVYDVLILGGGAAGQFQARHLLRNIPGIRIAMVEPKTDDEILRIDKIGESTVEIAATFLARDLGLIDYLIEHQLPKCGLAFHWPRDPAKTESIDDYYSSWPTRNPTLASYQLHRGTLERDLMRMNRADGVTVLRGKVVDVDLTEGDALNACTYTALPSGEQRTVRATHLIDCAGRAFLTGRKTGNVQVGPTHLYGLHNGTAWVRVSGVDRERFVQGMLGERACTSQYYVTNHWFGTGHWLWMIPIDAEAGTLSVGVMYHHDVIPAKSINSQDKLLAFLEQNHHALWSLIQDCPVDDFVHLARPAHISKSTFFRDNWYVIGDAAYIFDAFYSQGLSTVAMAVTMTTEIIRSKRAAEPDAEEKRAAYDAFNLWWAQNVCHLYRHHDKLLGNASLMSARIYLEYIWWFGAWVPLYYGKWMLSPKFIGQILRNCERHFFAHVYEDLLRAQEEGRNIGFWDTYRADQLPGVDWSPTLENVTYLENVESDPQRLNIYRSIAKAYRMTARWWVTFQWRAFGWRGVLRPRSIAQYLRLRKQHAKLAFAGLWHDWTHRDTPNNEAWAKLQTEFEGYRYQPGLQPWDAPEPRRATGT